MYPLLLYYILVGAFNQEDDYKTSRGSSKEIKQNKKCPLNIIFRKRSCDSFIIDNYARKHKTISILVYETSFKMKEILVEKVYRGF